MKGFRAAPSTEFKPGQHWRPRKPFWDKAWLEKEYTGKNRSAKEIALEFGITESAIFFWLGKHGIPRRSMSEARKIKHWGAIGYDNPMWNKRGELNPHWLGGVTPERQSFYVSQEWKTACSAVWKRDDAKCRRCGLDWRDSKGIPFHIHHLVSFAVKESRAEVSNLILLCEICHNFVHSRKNINHEFLPEGGKAR